MRKTATPPPIGESGATLMASRDYYRGAIDGARDTARHTITTILPAAVGDASCHLAVASACDSDRREAVTAGDFCGIGVPRLRPVPTISVVSMAHLARSPGAAPRAGNRQASITARSAPRGRRASCLGRLPACAAEHFFFDFGRPRSSIPACWSTRRPVKCRHGGAGSSTRPSRGARAGSETMTSPSSIHPWRALRRLADGVTGREAGWANRLTGIIAVIKAPRFLMMTRVPELTVLAKSPRYATGHQAPAPAMASALPWNGLRG